MPTEPPDSGPDYSPVLAGLSLLPTRRGRPAEKEKFSLEYVRDITEADVQLFNSLPAERIPIVPLAELRHRHHQLAQLLAAGTPNVEASLITGYSVVNVKLLQNDPAFQELLAFYEENKLQAFVDAQKKLATLGTTAVELLQEKLERTDPDDIGVGALTDVIKTAYDRSIAPDKGRGGGNGNGSGTVSPVVLNVQFVASGKAPERTGPTIDLAAEVAVGEDEDD